MLKRILSLAFAWGLASCALPPNVVVLIPDEGGTVGKVVVATDGTEAPLSNVRDAHVTGPFRWWTAVGPRMSFVDDGLTFGTNAQAGVCIHFDPPVPRVIGFKDHSALTVTVADPEALQAALKAGLEASD